MGIPDPPEGDKRDGGKPQHASVALVVLVAAQVEALPGSLLRVTHRVHSRRLRWRAPAAETRTDLGHGACHSNCRWARISHAERPVDAAKASSHLLCTVMQP